MSFSVSVIIPSFNRARYLPRAIHSVLRQSMSEEKLSLQVVVIDDGSTDDTAQLDEFQSSEVEYYFQENQGVSAARNCGIRNARHEWIALLDSDDEWLPGKLAMQYNELHRTGWLACHTDEIWIRNGKLLKQLKKHRKYQGWIFDRCLPLCAISPSAIILHRSIFDQIGYFDESLPACEDYDMWLRLCANYPVAMVDTPLLNKYGGHSDQLSRQHWGMDRFRVIALEKILNSNLSDQNHAAARLMLIKKLQILMKGANKHQNQPLLDWCHERLARHSMEEC